MNKKKIAEALMSFLTEDENPTDSLRISATSNPQDHPYEVGEKYFIRTVTHHYTGVLTSVSDKELTLEKCAWIANDGRFSETLKSGEHDEVEPYPEGSTVIIGRGALIDASKYEPELPMSQK